MLDRRTVLRGSAITMGMLGIAAVEAGLTPAAAAEQARPLLGNPAETGEGLPFPKHLTREELAHLKTFDTTDFVVFNDREWDRLAESHAQNIRVHWPDGHFTDGLARHIADMQAFVAFAPDTQVTSHPIRVAKGELTAVHGVFAGTFTAPLQTPNGTIPPTGRSFAVNMVTIGIWNRQGRMDEELVFFDQLTLLSQIGAL